MRDETEGQFNPHDIIANTLGITENKIKCKMKAFNFTTILLATILLSACSDISSSEENKIFNKEELLLAIDKFNKAFAECDIVILESMITENYQHTNGNSKSIGKESWISYLNKRKVEIESGKLIVNNYQMDQAKIEFFHNTAIVTARIVSLMNKQGKIQENQHRVTNLWVNENGKWKRAGFHDAKIR